MSFRVASLPVCIRGLLGPIAAAVWKTMRILNGDPEPIIHRIMMTADPLGGVWTHALELARAHGCLNSKR